MIERTVIGLMSLAFTSLVLPFIGQYMDPLLTTTTIFDRQNDLNSLSKQNQDTTFDYIIGKYCVGILSNWKSNYVSINIYLQLVLVLPEPF